MTTVRQFEHEEIRKSNPHLSSLKTTVETAFYGNNVKQVASLREAYALAEKAPNTIILSQLVSHTKELGLDSTSHVLLTNGGAVTGRTARARRIVGRNIAEDDALLPIIRDAIYHSHFTPYISSSAVVGLDEDFMVTAHIMMPEQEANNLYSWLLNFQIIDEEYRNRLEQSTFYDENDIYIFFDPTWSHPDYPDGLAYFDVEHNVAAILGMNYFGEIKKGTLTLAWATAARNGYVACHGGLKIFRDEEKDFVASFFGLSGSGKSTLTHAKHDGHYDIKVLHDDAFIISTENGSSIALEPSYFDKTNDYPTGHPEQEFFVTVQNCGVTLDKEGNKVLVTQDIRNGNGRTVKSRYSTPNRVDKINEPINAIFWIMKDDSLPPLIKVNDPILGATLGCTLMTKRSTAENVKGSRDELVIEPYANPFRVYPLQEDFEKFNRLFEDGVDCYIINTNQFMGQDITKEVTLDLIEQVVDGRANYLDFGLIDQFEYVGVDGFTIPKNDHKYKALIHKRMQFRLNYLLKFNEENPDDPLPVDAIRCIQDVVNKLRVKKPKQARYEW